MKAPAANPNRDIGLRRETKRRQVHRPHRRVVEAALEYLVRIEPKPVFEPSIRRCPARPVQALDIALDKKDPKRKLERRKARQKTTKARPRPEEVSQDVTPGALRVKDEPARSRYIPSEAIERVHARGKHQCEYKQRKIDERRGRREVQEHRSPLPRAP